jgi:hypothetical protein
MRAGTKCAIAIPALTALIFGYGAYRLHLHYAKAKAIKNRDICQTSPYPGA